MRRRSESPPIVTLAQARKHGLRHYFTGKLCPAGHVSKRRVSSRSCIACAAARDARFRATAEGHAKIVQYRESPKGREANRRGQVKYRKTPKGRVARQRYVESPKGRETLRRISNGPKGREKRYRYFASPKGREAMHRFNVSPKGRETLRAHQGAPQYRAKLYKNRRMKTLEKAIATGDIAKANRLIAKGRERGDF